MKRQFVYFSLFLPWLCLLVYLFANYFWPGKVTDDSQARASYALLDDQVEDYLDEIDLSAAFLEDILKQQLLFNRSSLVTDVQCVAIFPILRADSQHNSLLGGQGLSSCRGKRGQWTLHTFLKISDVQFELEVDRQTLILLFIGKDKTTFGALYTGEDIRSEELKLSGMHFGQLNDRQALTLKQASIVTLAQSSDQMISPTLKTFKIIVDKTAQRIMVTSTTEDISYGDQKKRNKAFSYWRDTLNDRLPHNERLVSVH